MLLKDRVAIVTGGAGVNGLGYKTACMMAEQGAKVVIMDLAQANPEKTAAAIGVPNSAEKAALIPHITIT